MANLHTVAQCVVLCSLASCSGVDGTILQPQGDGLSFVEPPPAQDVDETAPAPEAELGAPTDDPGTPLPGASSAEEAPGPFMAERPMLAPFERRCGSGALTELGQRALNRAPYLQHMTDDSVAVLYKWRFHVPALETLVVSTPDGVVVAAVRPSVDPTAGDRLQRVARVVGLEPSTYYCYSINGLTHRIGFRTAPARDVGAPVRFAVLGDSGGGGGPQVAVREQLEMVELDLWLHTGDIAYEVGSLEQFEQRFFGVYSDLLKSIPSFPVPGNHEYVTSAAAPFLEVFDLPANGVAGANERWYSFDWGDVHFVGLDTEQLHAQQIDWLDRDLTENHLPWVVAYLHRPPYSSGVHGGNPTVEAAFVPVLERHHVPIVFAGHDHDYERTVPINGVTYVVTGGGGKNTRPVGSSWFTAHSERVMHFVSVEVSGDTLVLRAIDSTGRELDALELTR